MRAGIAGMEDGWLVAVPLQNTSRTCPCCGHVSAANRQSQAQFGCVECGFENNADVVGAINSDDARAFLRLAPIGIAVLKDGEDVNRPYNNTSSPLNPSSCCRSESSSPRRINSSMLRTCS